MMSGDVSSATVARPRASGVFYYRRRQRFDSAHHPPLYYTTDWRKGKAKILGMPKKDSPENAAKGLAFPLEDAILET